MKDHFAPKYFDEIENASLSYDYFRPVLKELIASLDCEQSKILDIGCGTGVFISPLVEYGYKNLYGIDSPHDYIKKAIERGYKQIDTIEDLNYDKLPYQDQFFDAVISKDVFEHLLNPSFVLTEVARVLKPNGLFLFHVPNHFPLVKRIRFLINNDIDTYSFFQDESRWSFPHIRFYEHQDTIKVFNQNEFSLVKNLCSHFVAIPIISQIPFLVEPLKKMAHNYPNQFSQGFTYLFQKTNKSESENV